MQLFSSNPSKAWAEKFFLIYAPIWIFWFVLIIYFGWYIDIKPISWIYLTLPMMLVCILVPLVLQPRSDRAKPFFERYWVKMNVWIGIFNFVGNYFWTHYFFSVLGASYTMDTYRLNNIPYLMFFATQAYFTFYHALTNVLQRAILTGIKDSTTRKIVYVLFIAAFAYFTAFMETFTIQHFKYYTFVDRRKMYTIGSAFYALYFVVSFPMFYRIDEGARKWSISEVAIDSLGASMLVTILLDFWRLIAGNIHGGGSGSVSWIYQQ